MSDNQNILKSKFEAIKKISDQTTKTSNKTSDFFKGDLESVNGIIRRKPDDYQSKRNSKITGNRDIFGEVVQMAETFVGANGETNTDIDSKPKVMNKLMKFGTESASTTLRSSKQIIMETVQSELFSGDGICGANKNFFSDELVLSPKEFDFLDMLKVSPESTSGKIIYENDEDIGFIKMNNDFYKTFDALTYEFITNQGNNTFNLEWDTVNQTYIVTGLLNNPTVQDFLTDYYSNIEFPDINNVLSQTMYLTINGDGEEPKSFTIGMDWLNRLLDKIFSACGQPFNENPLDQNAANQVNDEVDLEYFFDFENTEGIDLDDEANRLKRVLKFVDCNNFESEIDTSHIKDFVYFVSRNRNMDDNINDTIERIARETNENSGEGIPPINLQISLTLKYLLNLPRSIMAAVLSPKMFFPIAVVYKSLKNVLGEVDVVEIMKEMSKLFFRIIKKLFWTFLKEFWQFIKVELLNFLKKLALTILKNMLKRFKNILSSLTSLLETLLTVDFASCDSMYELVLTAIDSALNSAMSIPIPGVLLAFSDTAPGYSTDRAYMNVIEKLTASGIPTEPLYGRDNSLNTVVKSIIEGHTEEMDANSYVKISLKPTIIPAAVAGAVISPAVVGSGKLF